ncbi:MAG: hypothetical protein H7263_12890 [Candidatus Sericytochromatia bacterium]|nr:hypothetical protein [Candidatus Sericytochromatia bacterium]
MKKTILSKLLTSIFISSFIFSCSTSITNLSSTASLTTDDKGILGATLQDSVWTKYNLKFKLPTDLKQTKNEDGEFVAGSNAIIFDILQFKDFKGDQNSILVEALTHFKIDGTGVNGIDGFTSIPNYTGAITINGVDGFIVSGTAKKDSILVNINILSLNDKVNLNSYISYVIFDPAKASDNEKKVNFVGDIFSSFFVAK